MGVGSFPVGPPALYYEASIQPDRDGNVWGNEIRMLVHSSQAGGIIGRAGHRINELRKSTGAEIKVYAEKCPMSTDRVVAVSGDRDTVVGAVREIMQVCEEVGQRFFSKAWAPGKGASIFGNETSRPKHKYIHVFGMENGVFGVIVARALKKVA